MASPYFSALNCIPSQTWASRSLRLTRSLGTLTASDMRESSRSVTTMWYMRSLSRRMWEMPLSKNSLSVKPFSCSTSA